MWASTPTETPVRPEYVRSVFPRAVLLENRGRTMFAPTMRPFWFGGEDGSMWASTPTESPCPFFFCTFVGANRVRPEYVRSIFPRAVLLENHGRRMFAPTMRPFWFGGEDGSMWASTPTASPFFRRILIQYSQIFYIQVSQEWYQSFMAAPFFFYAFR